MVQYHVTLDGQGYLLDLDRYQKRIREPFPGKQSQGAVSVGDLRGPEQVLVISDWSGGEGYTHHDEARPGRYRSGGGIDGYTVPGTLRLGPYASTIGTTSANSVTVLQPYGSKLYGGGSSGEIYTWDGTTFSLLITFSGNPQIQCTAVFLRKLYVGNAGNALLASFDGTTWANAATAGGPVYFLATHYRETAEYLYLGAVGAGTGGTGRLYSWDGATLSLGLFDTEEPIPFVAFVQNGKLYIGAGDGAALSWALYSVDDSGSGGRWRRHTLSQGSGFPVSAVVHDGLGYIGDFIGGRLWRWDEASLNLVLDLSAPGAAYTGALRALASWRGGLWVGIKDGSGLGLLRFDPAGDGGAGAWHRAVTGLTGTDVGSAAVWSDRLYLGTSQTGAARVYRVDPTLYGGSGQVESGLIAFGLPGVTKLLRSVTLVTAPLPSGQSVQVEYRLEDAGAWTSLGTLATANATTATYAFPAGTTCRQLSLRLTLTGSGGSASSPVVHELAVRYVPRPAVTREWELAVVLEGTPELPLVTLDGEPAPLTGAQLTSALWNTAASSGPVTLVDLDGASYSVYVQDIREEVAKISQRKGYQRLGIVRLVEAA